METTTEDWKRLGRYIRRRREQLRLSQQDLSARGGPSVATIRNLEAGEQEGYRYKTFSQVEEALGWAEGSVDAILANGEPTPLETSTSTTPRAAEAKAAAAAPAPPPDPLAILSTEDLIAARDHLLAQLPEDERQAFLEEIRRIEQRVEQLRIRRDLLWAKLIRGQAITPADVDQPP